jgi:hypothetical protein
VGRAARAIGQTTLHSHAINQYCKRLNVINATFGDTDQHIGALGDLLRAESP